MRRTISTVVALVLVVGALTAVPFVMAQQTDTEQASENTTGNESVAPGAQLSGVVAVGEAELDGEIADRAYGIRVARANSSDAKAAVVADQLNRTSERVAALEDRRQALEQARANGTLSQGEYRARIAGLVAESRNAERMVDRTNETASGLPAETLEANGVNATAIRTLSDRTANLTGPETAEIARGIAGEGVGQAGGPDDRTGAPGNRTENGADRTGDTAPSTPDEPGPADGDSSTGTNETTSPDGQD
ncbi:hypothetical protein [Haloarcula laminariae]|uniref:hypothetical protein n=1 Tax=Haloarcula laminariae TaxID=2961577 RepID=UPI0021C69676|nr:hypothetical protein [Halomicroarcula laminariae]